MLRRTASAIIVSALFVTSPALAQQTFASFTLSPNGTAGTSNMLVTSPGATGGTTITGYSTRTGSVSNTDFIKAYSTNGMSLSNVGLVNFNFNTNAGLANNTSGNVKGVAANLFFLNTSSSVASAISSPTGFFTPNFTGSLVFKPVDSGTFVGGRTYTPNSILLAVNFQDGVLVRAAKSPKSFGDSTGSAGALGYDPSEVSFYSDFLTFGSGNAERGFQTSFTGDKNNASGTSFIASLNGTFDNTALPTESAPPVPELATWGMMIVGFGAVGSTMRRRRSTRNKVLATA